MIHYSAWQWLLIDAATQYGLDKLTFEERIQWAETNLPNLEALIADAPAKEKPLYQKAVLAIRKAQKGLPTGHMVAVDACASGAQLMSVLTGCEAGALATGLIDPDVRADAYSSLTEAMNVILGSTLAVPRKDAKQAYMTVLYGSKATPKIIFGEDTPEIAAFYQAVQQVTPGAWELLQDLLQGWNPYALEHSWKMPDGYDVMVRVMEKKEARIEVDELDHATFTYEFYENQGTKRGISLPANCIHSVDGYVLRSMHRRCNYDPAVVKNAYAVIEIEMLARNLKQSQQNYEKAPEKVGYYVDQYYRSGLADVVILPHLCEESVQYLDSDHLGKLMVIIQGMLQYKPFPLVTVHDAFASHAGNVNWVRWQYKEILAEIADSDLINDLLSQIYGMPGNFQKLSIDLGNKIRRSNYALC